MSETSRFTEDILSAANEKAQAIVAEAEAQTQKALEEAKTHIAREAEDILRNGRAESEGVKRRQVSEVRHRLKLEEQQEKSRILTDVMEQVKRRIIDITKDETKYLPLLVGVVAKSIRELAIDVVLIHLNAQDLERFDKGKLEREVTKKLEKPVEIKWSKKPLEVSGGAIVSSPDGRTRIVDTVEQRFEALEPKLLIEAGRLLFGD